ncbi:hypothetical protein ATO6_01485 [Oceanicola sp. 22II-s10i]|uniref:MFS transporter n=1 Tax=Oceanicola sp. 22II-s10i TaxID=1317116 RepID=UPI000B51FEC2|nr:MFS transporter [Oceanicola sp. 22II-s10i]OWU85631.1 hypothetical protein ATO6_01485 [Oceanicola sp. 22II-s10i]
MDRERLRTVSALGIVQIFSWGSSFYLLAVIAAPLREETGWPFGLVTAGISLGLLVSGVAAVVVGRLIERFGGRRVMAGGMGLLALGLTIIATSHHPAVYIGAWIIMGMGMASGLYDAAFGTLGRIYGKDARGPISALTLWGGFASTVCWPLTAFLVAWIGWRGACLSYAAIHVFITAPICIYGLPRAKNPQPVAAKNKDATPAGSVLRDKRFWLFSVCMTVTGGLAAFWSTHLITILTSQGMTLAAAVALGTIIGPAQVGARVLEMLGRGKHHPVWTTFAYAVCAVLGFGGLALGVPATIAFLFYGAGNGLWSIARGAFPLAAFGPERYARTVGMLALPTFTASAIAPLLGGALIERFGTDNVIPASALITLVPFAAMLALLADHLRRKRAGGY